MDDHERMAAVGNRVPKPAWLIFQPYSMCPALADCKWSPQGNSNPLMDAAERVLMFPRYRDSKLFRRSR